jgi:hypothetical protein
MFIANVSLPKFRSVFKVCLILHDVMIGIRYNGNVFRTCEDAVCFASSIACWWDRIRGHVAIGRLWSIRGMLVGIRAINLTIQFSFMSGVSSSVLMV